MANVNPLEPGDAPYNQYATYITNPISAALAIVKGVIYTSDAAGNLVAVTDTVVKGTFQATAPAAANATAGEDRVQVLTTRSRILMKAPAGITKGDSMLLSAGGAAVVKGAKNAVNYIGSVFELYTKDSNGTVKEITVADDLVTIDMAGV